MFDKILLVMCDVTFWFYGKLYKYSVRKGLADVAIRCIAKREDILDNIATLKGIA